MTDYTHGKTYTLRVSRKGPWPFRGNQEAKWDAEMGGFAFTRDNGGWAAYPDVHAGKFAVVGEEPTWQPPLTTPSDAEWAAQTVDTLAKVGIPTEDIPNALRLVARLQERGIDNAAEVAGIAHVWLVASRG